MNIVYMVVFQNRKILGLLPHSYIGSKSNCRYNDGVIFDNRGKPYFGSSKSKFYGELLESGELVTVDILGEFDTSKDALLYERELHIKYKVSSNPEYFNMAIAADSNYTLSNYGTYKHAIHGTHKRLPIDHDLVKSGEYVGVTKGRVMTKEERMSRSGGVGSFTGKTHSQETKDLLSKKAKDRPSVWDRHDDKTKKRIIEALSSKKTKEHKEKIGEKSKGLVVVVDVNTNEKSKVTCDEYKILLARGSHKMVSSGKRNIRCKDTGEIHFVCLDQAKEMIDSGYYESFNVGGNHSNSKRVYVMGVEYDSISTASRERDIKYHTIQNRLKSKKFDDYFYVE